MWLWFPGGWSSQVCNVSVTFTIQKCIIYSNRSKNTVNILIKNWLDMCLGAIVYWALGFGLTWGEDVAGFRSRIQKFSFSPDMEHLNFSGSSFFIGVCVPPHLLSKFFFQFTFAATASTLVSGALAERCNFIAYLVYCVLITGVIYPVLAHWCWHHEGWLYKLGQS